MSNIPKFSVIVPAYNSAAFIKKGLNSIHDQTYKNYELLIVCDKCYDQTHDIAKKYTDKVYDVDFGRDGLTRNFGIDYAEGEWILFMDDDDWWLHEYAFEMLNQALEVIDTDILAFAFIWKHVGFTRNTKEHLWIATWNKCWNRAAIGETRFGNVERESDVLFHYEMMKKNLKISIWDQPLYYYNYLRKGSQTYNMDIKTMRSFDANLKMPILGDKGVIKNEQ